MFDKGLSFSEWRAGLRARTNAQELKNMAAKYGNPGDPDVVAALSQMAQLITTVTKTVSGINDDLEAVKYDMRKWTFEIQEVNEKMMRYMYFTWVGCGFVTLILILNWIF